MWLHSDDDIDEDEFFSTFDEDKFHDARGSGDINDDDDDGSAKGSPARLGPGKPLPRVQEHSEDELSDGDGEGGGSDGASEGGGLDGGGLDGGGLDAFAAQYEDGDELDGDDVSGAFDGGGTGMSPVTTERRVDYLDQSETGQSSLDIEPDAAEGAILWAVW